MKIVCSHIDKVLNKEHGGTLYIVVSGLPQVKSVTVKCAYGCPEILAEENPWQMIIPLAALIDRKHREKIQPCETCKTENCTCLQCNCCLAGLEWLLAEHYCAVATDGEKQYPDKFKRLKNLESPKTIIESTNIDLTSLNLRINK